jgi:hypothetical protein
MRIAILSARMRDELRRVCDPKLPPGGPPLWWETPVVQLLREADAYDNYLTGELNRAMRDNKIPASYVKDILEERGHRMLGWKRFLSTMRKAAP